MRRFLWMPGDACLLLAVIVAACFVGSARADHIGDKDNYSQYLLLSPYGKCVDDAQIFADGMLNLNTGERTVDQAVAGAEWHSDRDREHYRELAQEGYDVMSIVIAKTHAELIAANPPEWKAADTEPRFPDELIEHWMNEGIKKCAGANSPTRSDVRFIKVQSQDLRDPAYAYPGGPRRLSGCHDNVEGLLADCTELPNHSEAQIGARFRCTADAWQKYFGCAQLYPPATLSEQIEREL